MRDVWVVETFVVVASARRERRASLVGGHRAVILVRLVVSRLVRKTMVVRSLVGAGWRM